MNIIFAKNYDEMSYRAAIILCAQIMKNKKSKIGFATGQTPIGTYKYLIDMYNKNILDFSDVVTFNLDEYCNLKNNNKSYHYFMKENLFKYININYNNVNIPKINCSNYKKECEDYENLIKKNGGIDIQILGIGINGHIGFNEPKPYFELYTHKEKLTKDTINSNKRFFDNKEEIPKEAISMGIKSIMSAKEILLLCSGENKTKIVKEILEQKNITPNLPASILNIHNNINIIIDKSTIKI